MNIFAIQLTSGPSSTRIDVTLYGFPPGRPVSVKLGAEESEFSHEIATGWTDANVNFAGQGFITPDTGRFCSIRRHGQPASVDRGQSRITEIEVLLSLALASLLPPGSAARAAPQ
jgi:hypothetical protein